MKCPYRKRTEEVDGIISEYFMECEGRECPYHYSDTDYYGKRYEECQKVSNEGLDGCVFEEEEE